MDKSLCGVNVTGDKRRPVFLLPDTIEQFEQIATAHNLRFTRNPVFGYFYVNATRVGSAFQGKNDWVFRLDFRSSVIRTNRGWVSFWYPQGLGQSFLKKIFSAIDQSHKHNFGINKPVDKTVAFNIIVSKRININLVIDVQTYEEYSKLPAEYPIIDSDGKYHPEYVLTEKEFDLLREALTYGKD